MASPSPLSFCGDAVRRHDPDRFLTALFAPAPARESLFALYAFNLEAARAREAASEPTIGRIRLQWWRDALDGVFAGRPPQHPVAAALAGAVARHGLPRGPFERLLAAREFDLDDRPPDDMAELVAYAEGTSGTLGALAAAALGAGEGEAAAAARHVGAALALVGLMRAVPFHARSRRLFLPRDRMAAAGLGADDVIERGPSPGLAHVVAEVVAEARARIAAARALRRSVPRKALAAVLPATLAEGYARRLERARFDPFDPRVNAGRAGRQLILALRAALGRY
ncbi:MAG: squalene/phytoene synthase family protein [Proteobacteria bacterium]|nr:squalene/phytoene synthase family protein [Pseudomonadota bacterium]